MTTFQKAFKEDCTQLNPSVQPVHGSTCTTEVAAQAWSIFTDGACLGNPGPGGCAALFQSPEGQEWSEAWGYRWTTNNRMELLAAIHALERLPPAPTRIQLTTDSQYLQMGMMQWLPKWSARGWVRADGQAVKNRDLWQRLESLIVPLGTVEWCWVRGHGGHPQNERCDQMAKQAARAPQWEDLSLEAKFGEKEQKKLY